MICCICKEDGDTTEFYTWDNEHHDKPRELCDKCVEEQDMKKILCDECFNKWRGFR